MNISTLKCNWLCNNFFLFINTIKIRNDYYILARRNSHAYLTVVLFCMYTNNCKKSQINLPIMWLCIPLFVFLSKTSEQNPQRYVHFRLCSLSTWLRYSAWDWNFWQHWVHSLLCKGPFASRCLSARAWTLVPYPQEIHSKRCMWDSCTNVCSYKWRIKMYQSLGLKCSPHSSEGHTYFDAWYFRWCFPTDSSVLHLEGQSGHLNFQQFLPEKRRYNDYMLQMIYCNFQKKLPGFIWKPLKNYYFI